MAKAPARSGKHVGRGPKAAAAKAKRPTKARSKPQGIAPLPPENLARARINVTTIGDLLLTAADRYPRFARARVPGRALTYAQLATRALRRARSLQALGVRAARPRRHPDAHLRGVRRDVLRDRHSAAASSCRSMRATRSNELAYVIENGDIVTVVTTDAVAESGQLRRAPERRVAGPRAQPRPAQAPAGAARRNCATSCCSAGPTAPGYLTEARLRRAPPRPCNEMRRASRAPAACACATSA